MPAERAFLCHGPHHVELRTSVPGLLVLVESFCRRLLAREPRGACAGVVVARFRDGAIVVAGGGSETDGRYDELACAARAMYHGAVRHLVVGRPQILWLHAGAVARDGGAWLFAARSGVGKSTLVAELLARGWTYLTDEVAAIDPVTLSIQPFPVTPWRRVNGGGVRLAPNDVLQLPKVEVEVPDPAVAPDPVPARGACLITYAPDAAEPRASRVAPASAVAELMVHSFGTRVTRDAELRGLCRLVARVPVMRVEYRDAATLAEWVIASSDPRLEGGARSGGTTSATAFALAPGGLV